MELGSVDAGLAYTEEMGLPELFVIEEQYRKAVMEAELAFVSTLATRIESDELGGIALVAHASTSSRRRATASRRSRRTR